ncbi:MAG: low molecular weight protein-tyrosine-phosphatase [Phycisphaerales bacterium]|nr:low molecular weight protein-tyrosine-phosphatase [Phycisphaerales bacterium]
MCMGNICRSPTAEAMFRHHAEREGVLHHFDIDSAGTGAWHAGEAPDARMTEAAAARGVRLAGSARQISREDLDRYDYVLCMDGDNLDGVQALGPASARVQRMLEYGPAACGGDVPDPYYGGARGFTQVVEMLDVACRDLLRVLIDDHGLEQ